MSEFSIKLYFIALGAGLASAFLPGGNRKHRSWPVVTLVMAAMVASMFAAPRILPLLARDPAPIDRGQLWRAITALFVQDGGVAGFLFNLAALLLIGRVAERRWGTARWLMTYLGGGIVAEFLALAWQPHGAGNSVACFALAGGLTTYFVQRHPLPLQIVVRAVGLAAGAALIATRDIHGLAYGVGAIFGILFAIHDRNVANSRASAQAVLAEQP